MGLLLLGGYLALQAAWIKRWTAIDSRPPSWDQSVHLETALDDRRAIAAADWAAVWRPIPKPGMPPFPPLYYLALQPALRLSANPARAAVWVNYGYLVVLAFSLFGIAFGFRDDWTAAAATVAFLCAPAVQELLYTPLVDLPLLACSTAAYWAFLGSDRFRRWGPSLAFGALFAVGMLHKWSFFSYMIPAYLVSIGALRDRRRPKGPLAASWALAAALTLPWYAANWPSLLPRLLQAGSDFAVPVWHGAAFLHYLWSSVESLGPLLWLMGWLGLLVPSYRRHRERGWLIPLWVVSSYIFWAVVPNRQMRFLLPGLPGLAVAASGCWPDALVAVLLAVQLFGAANYARGWLGPLSLPTPMGNVALFPSSPPSREDWHVDDILRAAESRADASAPIDNLVLIANARYFNGPTFTWRRSALDLPRLRLRGVNKRLCELAQFVVLKQASLGPPSVIGGLEEAAAQTRRADGWFSKSYAEVQSWPLPDGSRALLYERRKPARPPFGARRRFSFKSYRHAGFSASDLELSLGRYDARSGDYPRALVSARELELRGLRATGVRLELDGLLATSALPPPADPWEDVRLLKLKALRLRSLTITAADLRRFLEARVKGLRLDALSIDGAIAVSGRYRGMPVSAALTARLRGGSSGALALRLAALRLGPVRLPVAALNRIKELTISLRPNPETPFAIEVPGLTLKDGRLTVP